MTNTNAVLLKVYSEGSIRGGEVICTVRAGGSVGKANARLIVRAVNSHADLLAAAEAALMVLDDMLDPRPCPQEGFCGLDICNSFGCLNDKVLALRAAIKKGREA
jgi:hypothetical protein